MKILLVDDSRTMRNIVKKSLEGLGAAEFSEAGDGVEALKVIAAAPAPFDLMIVDWNMPNMDGITLVHKVRETDKKTLIMMVTTEAEKSRVVEAIKAGVNNYAVKPFTPETILEKVNQTLSKAKAAAQPINASVMDVAYINPFISSVRRVFKDMVHVSCIVGKPFLKRDGHRFHLLYSHAATIQLTGAVRGMISLVLAQPVALSLAGAFAGEIFPDLNADCADALTEIVNVVAGAAKKEMPGGQISLSIAQLQRTHKMSYPSGTSVIVIPFDTDKGRLVMEVALAHREAPACEKVG